MKHVVVMLCIHISSNIYPPKTIQYNEKKDSHTHTNNYRL